MKEANRLWKEIEGYEGIYEVSDEGKVRSIDRFVFSRGKYKWFKKGKELAIIYNKRNDVFEVHLKKNGVRKCMKLHILVAKTFIPNPNNLPTVNHLDGDRSNNHVSNLEWASYSTNLKHSYEKLNRPHNANSIKNRPCECLNKITGEVFRFNSIAEASRNINISQTQIRRIIDKKCINKNYEIKYI